MGVHGENNMYLLQAGKPSEAEGKRLSKLALRPGWLAQSIRVMDGDFTVESDKHALIDVILGLYGFTVICAKEGGGVQALIETDKDAVRLPQRARPT